ncbi:anti-sigma factor [Paenibacillus sp. OV219]|uniref:anti-sigma factor family protein n=1 Tax=Paenibacillus sp. OV219 TaxID=1884377 RepID=UPI0008D37707|nr:zf-HC2 domain-containing protein [Paenibacillus sp. OV219]SEN64190.1 hypothetical protein SAMN05518847_103385 [Paenibacillus sp. OV219]
MNHLDEAVLSDYAEDRLPELKRLETEAHLAECETCLSRYMDLLTSADEDADGLQVQVEHLSEQAADTITKRVMEQVRALEPALVMQAAELAAVHSPPQNHAGETVQRRKKVSRGSRRQTLIHYLIAVCVMLLLMSAGVFQRLADQPEHWEAQQLSKREPVTTSIMERTSAVIDSFIARPGK